MPDCLASLVDEGIIEEVLRPLMSGKEAQIYLVRAGGRECVAKIYKEAQNRTFKHRAEYTEGRKVRNTRDQRAIDKRSKHGRGQDEAAWRSTEVDMIYRLQAAGVRVPAPFHFIDGVLVMELVTDVNGEPAPRLAEVHFTPAQATAVYEQLIREVVRMLCAGVVHGDLSDFNVLLSAHGPVIIDFPQSVDPSKNQNARKLLLRDVDNLHRFHSRFVPAGRRAPYAEEMWALYESSQLTPDTPLRGQYRNLQKRTDTAALLELIGEVNEDERRRRAGSPAPVRPRRVEVIVYKNDRSGARSAPGPQPAPRASAPAHPAQPAPRASAPAHPRAPAPISGQHPPEAGLRDAARPAGPSQPSSRSRRRRRRRKSRAVNGSAAASQDHGGAASSGNPNAQDSLASAGASPRGPRFRHS